MRLNEKKKREENEERMTVLFESDCEDEKDAALIQLICKW
jgi:hypothetical protein